MHRPHRVIVLPDHRVNCSSAFGDVPFQTPDKADVVRRVHEDPNVQHLEDTRLRKYQDSLDDHHRPRLNDLDFLSPRVGLKIVKRHLR